MHLTVDISHFQHRDSQRVSRLQNRRRELLFLRQKRHIAVGELQHHRSGHQRFGQEHFRPRGGGRRLYW